MHHVDCIVIGAGVVGLAVARELALAGHEVVVIERERAFGTGISSRSSEVIHAGLYDAPGSLKSTLAVEGKALLYAYCEARHVDHRRCGKLVVAEANDDVPRLASIAANARANGVDDLALVSVDTLRSMEPALRGAAALFSPSSGIVDSHGLMSACLADLESAGGLLVCGTAVRAIERATEGWCVRFANDATYRITCRWLVNSAGLDAQAVAHAMVGFPVGSVPTLHRAKGNYFAPSTRSPFSRLIYPLPVDGGLGVHLTLDLGGGMRFGPDVEWLDAHTPADYTVDPRRAQAFHDAIRRYWPGLPDGSLEPAYCGIRPKLSSRGQPKADFRIDGPGEHGCEGVVHLFGIESPGITASLAIARLVHAKLRDASAG